ncbi:MAG TPA: response regulator [Candidatus Limnocylindria bacterium]
MTASDQGTLNGHAPRVAVVDSDRRVQQSLAEVLRVAGVDVIGTAGDVRAALELISKERPSVVLLDPRLPDLDAGMALLASVSRGWPSVRVVLMGWAAPGEARLPDDLSFVSKSASSEEFVSAALAACHC